jgi:hypothetical protein
VQQLEAPDHEVAVMEQIDRGRQLVQRSAPRPRSSDPRAEDHDRLYHNVSKYIRG